MQPFERTHPQQIITSTIAWISLAATIGFIIALLTSASEFSSSTSASMHGPLNLFLISKTPLGDGATEVSMALMPGSIIYFATALCATIMLIFFRLRKH